MLGVLEGILFVGGDEGISLDRLVEVLELDKKQVEDLIDNYKESLLDDNRGFELEYFGEKYKLATKKEHNEYYKKLVEVSKNDTLSQASLETLAIITYNSPITRSGIEEIRGVDCTYVLRKLVFLNLIKECGRSELPGRPILYGITEQFLDYLGIEKVEDLPKPEPVHVEHDDIQLYDSKYEETI